MEDARRGGVGAYVRLARPSHWLKNAFVLAPVPFALKDGAHAEPRALAAGLAGFCLAASAAYAANDAVDRDADRLHPRKRLRPVASGEVSRPAAFALAAVLAASGVALSWVAGGTASAAAAGGYLALAAAYDLGLRRVPLLDVFAVAGGFLLRVVYGCTLVRAPPSSWLLLCTSAVALLLGFGKRRAEILEDVGPGHRESLGGTSQGFLDRAIVLCGGVTLVAYAMYVVNAPVLVPSRRLASLPFVAFGVLEYLRLSDRPGGPGDPVDVAYASRALQVCAALWVAAVLWSVGWF